MQQWCTVYLGLGTLLRCHPMTSSLLKPVFGGRLAVGRLRLLLERNGWNYVDLIRILGDL